MSFIIIIIFFLLPTIFIAIGFLKYLFVDKSFVEKHSFVFLEVMSIVIFPVFFLMGLDLSEKNNCCSDSAVFSPAHRLSVYLLIALCIACYFYCALRNAIATPIIEVITNSVLIIGIVLNILIAIQVKETYLWLIGNISVIMLFILMLMRNQDLFLKAYEDGNMHEQGLFKKFCWSILKLDLFKKLPVLVIFCLPVLMLLVCILLLFGQKPDSFVKAFTDTYKHGFSKLDYQCYGVVCGGHFLCTIAAKGHADLVKPLRKGTRGEKQIVCNRQLLISNAFEELLEQKLPFIHKPVRKLYNVIGSYIHRYYGLFKYRLVSDIIYVLMKPLEWFFLFALYIFDKKPENRIAQQYLSADDRQLLKRLMTEQVKIARG